MQTIDDEGHDDEQPMRRGKFFPDQAEDFKPYAKLEPDSFKPFLEALERELSTITLSVDEVIAECVRRFQPFQQYTPDEQEALSSATFGFMYLRHTTGSKVARLTKDLADAYAQRELEGTESSEDLAGEVVRLTENLTALLNNRAVNASVKARTLLDDQDKIFWGARVITDIRPVFDDNVSETFAASLVVHTLRLSFQVNGKVETIFIGADSDDLRQLKEQLQRALDKAQTTTRLIASSLASFGAPIDRGDGQDD